MSAFLHIDEKNFKESVLNSSQPVLLEFGAPWCRPCKSLEPILLQLGDEWGDRVLLAKVTVDESPDLAMQHQVISVPTTILFVGGEEQARFVGLQKPDKIRKMIEQHI